MRSIGFKNFQQCCFRLPDWWSNSTHWMARGRLFRAIFFYYNDVIMSPMASQITSLTIVYSTVYSGADQRKHQKLRATGLCEGNSPMTGEVPHKGPVTRKMFPFDDVIMWWFILIPFASWFLLPALPLNYALSWWENGLLPQERIETIFSQNKPMFKPKMSLKVVSAKYRAFVGTGATYTISLEICTRIGKSVLAKLYICCLCRSAVF